MEKISELVERARTGDLDAFGLLVERTTAMVRSVVRAEIDDPDLAEDAAQDVYVRAYRHLADLREPNAFAGWLGRVAASVARDLVRGRRRAFVEYSDQGDVPDTRSDDSVPASSLDRAVAALPATDRQLLERYYRGGWTTARLAVEEGVGEPAIRKRLQRLRETMRDSIRETMRRGLDKETDMDRKAKSGTAGDLPARVVELLARPLQIDLPESAVGSVWAKIRASRPHDEVVELPERIPWTDLERVCGPTAAAQVRDRIFATEAGTVLRYDLTIPMLIAARGRPAGTVLLAAGKVYRDDPEDREHTAAYHQAEALWIGEGFTEWDLIEWLTPLLHELLPGSRIRFEETEFPYNAVSGYEIAILARGAWTEIGGLARFRDETVSALAHDPSRVSAVGIGLGLERIAALRIGIDDVRRVSIARVGD